MRSLKSWIEFRNPEDLDAFFSSVILGENLETRDGVPTLEAGDTIFFNSNKKMLETLFLNLRRIIKPIVQNSAEENNSIQNYIKIKIVSNYEDQYDDVFLNKFIKEAERSAAGKIYKFIHIIEKVLKLNVDFSEADINSPYLWISIPLDDKPAEKQIPFKDELETIINEVFYKASRDTIVGNLDRYNRENLSIEKKEPFIEDIVDPHSSVSRKVLWKEIEDNIYSDFENSNRQESQSSVDREKAPKFESPNTKKSLKKKWENLPVKWRIPIMIGVLMIGLVAPMTFLVAVTLWQMFVEKKSEEESGHLKGKKSDLFKAENKAPPQRRQISELSSDTEVDTERESLSK